MSVRWKIYTIAIISIFGFGVYLAFNMKVNTQNATLLEGVRDVYFPILEKANANAVRLDQIAEMQNAGVMAGEEDYFDNAAGIAATMTQVFKEILVIEPIKKNELRGIINSFDKYFSLSDEIAREMASGDVDFESLAKRAEEKEIYLGEVRENLKSFISYARNNFTGDIRAANTNSKTLLTSGLAIWGVNILILSLVVYTIARIILKNINTVSKSLHKIASGEGDLNQKIAVSSKDEIGRLACSFNELMENLKEKTNDLVCMMENMHQGLFTITNDGSIHPEYATYLEQIFATQNIANKHYTELLFNNSLLGSDAKDSTTAAVGSIMGSEAMMWDFNAHLLPTEYIIKIDNQGNEEQKILELDWDPIVAEDVVDKIMVTVRDVTELRAMQAEARKQQEEMDMLGQILHISPAKFDGFLSNSKALLEKNYRLVNETRHKDYDVIAQLFVNMHTIKGNARTYKLDFITNQVHDAESTYDRLRKEEGFDWDQQTLLFELKEVESAIQRYEDIRNEKLDFSDGLPDANDMNTLRLPKDLYLNFLETLKHFSEDPAPENANQLQQFYGKFRALNASALSMLIAEPVQSLPSVAEQLGKAPPVVDIEAEGLLFQNEYKDLLNNVFTHLLRNSLDHGLEAAEERAAKNKPEKGHIRITSEQVQDKLVLHVGDDGKGLNLRALREKAVENGAISPDAEISPDEIANFVFQSGLSTAEKLSDISGRGVGMDAVKRFLQEKQADIALKLDTVQNHDDSAVPFEFIISLPNHMYQRSQNS